MPKTNNEEMSPVTFKFLTSETHVEKKEKKKNNKLYIENDCRVVSNEEQSVLRLRSVA